MNEYDLIKWYCKKIDFAKTENLEEANCYLLNTCHIRDKAKEKVYHEIGRLKKLRYKKTFSYNYRCCTSRKWRDVKEQHIDLIIGPQAYHVLMIKLKYF